MHDKVCFATNDSHHVDKEKKNWKNKNGTALGSFAQKINDLLQEGVLGDMTI